MSCEKRDSCRTYLLPCSQADLQKFPDNKNFSNASKIPAKAKSDQSAWMTKTVVANNFIGKWAAQVDGVQFLSVWSMKMMLQLIFPPIITVATLQHTDIYAKKNHLVWTTQPRSPKFERYQMSDLKKEKRRKPSQKVLENSVNRLLALPKSYRSALIASAH